jgi:hypothetical protein
MLSTIAEVVRDSEQTFLRLCVGASSAGDDFSNCTDIPRWA